MQNSNVSTGQGNSILMLRIALVLLIFFSAAEALTIQNTTKETNVGNAHVGQSFKAEHDGLLKSITVQLTDNVGKKDTTLTLYSGEGTGGKVLLTQNIGSSLATKSDLTITLSKGITLTKGAHYTFDFTDAAALDNNNFYISKNSDRYSGGDLYVGQSKKSGQDLYFKLIYDVAPKLKSSEITSYDWQVVGTEGFSEGSAYTSDIAFDPNGTPYVIFADKTNGNKATVMKYSGSAWEVVGSKGFSDGQIDDASIAFDSSGTPYISYEDYGNSFKATVMKYSGGTWQVVGSKGFSDDYVNNTSLALDSDDTLYIAYMDAGNDKRATVMKFNGSSWVAVGNKGFTSGYPDYLTFALNSHGTPYIAYKDGSSSYKANVMKYNGSSWESVCNSDFSDSYAYNLSLDFDSDGTPYVAYKDAGNVNKATVMKCSGSTWEAVGSKGFSDKEAYYPSLTIDTANSLVVAYKDMANGKKLTVMKYNGTAWNPTGIKGFSSGTLKELTLKSDPDGTLYAAYIDDDNDDKATVMKGILELSLMENNTAVTDLNATDADGDSVTFSLSGSDINAFNINASTGILSLKSSPDYENPADANGDNVYEITITVTDPDGLKQSFPIHVRVNDVGESIAPPTDINLTSSTIIENSTAGTAVGTFASIDIDVGDPHVYSFCGGTDDTDFTIEDDTLKTAAVFDYESKSSYSICIRSTDSGNGTFDKTFLIQVGNANDAPLITEGSSTAVTMSEDGSPTPFTLTLHATDADNDTLSWSIVSKGSHGNASVGDVPSGTSQQIGYIPDTDYTGTESFTVQVSDGKLSDTITINVTLSPVNDAPVVTSLPTTTADKDTAYLYNMTASDSEGDALTWSVKNGTTLPSWLTLTSNDGFETVGSAGFASSSGDVSIAIDGSGTPFVAYKDSTNRDVVLMKHENGSWITAGSSAGFADNPSLAVDGSGVVYVAYTDNANDYKATVMKYENGNFVSVGSAGFSAGYAFYSSIAFDGSGTPYLLYEDGSNDYKATVMKYNGNNWEMVGSGGFSAGVDSHSSSKSLGSSLAVDGSGTPYVAYKDTANGNKATVMKYDGSSWVTVGSPGFSASQVISLSIAVDSSGTPYVAYQDYGNASKATVMKYESGSWTAVGDAGFSTGRATYTFISINGSGIPYVVYADADNSGKATVMKYEANSWVNVGEGGFSAGNATYPSIAFDGNDMPYVSYKDYANDGKTTVMRFVSEKKLEGTATIAGVYDVNLSVSDGTGTTEQNFQITVAGDAPKNNIPTALTLSNSAIGENSAVGTIIGTLTTTDADSDDTHSYSFCGGSDDANFAISGITLKASILFDYESKNSYSICIRTTDSSNTFYDKTLTVHITDVNEAPRIHARSYNATEGGEVILGTLNATDSDKGATLSYALAKGFNTPSGFTLESNGSYAFDPKNDAYTKLNKSDTLTIVIPVVVTDDQGLSDENNLTITLTGITEQTDTSTDTPADNNGTTVDSTDSTDTTINTNKVPSIVLSTDSVTFYTDETLSFSIGVEDDSNDWNVSVKSSREDILSLKDLTVTVDKEKATIAVYKESDHTTGESILSFTVTDGEYFVEENLTVFFKRRLKTDTVEITQLNCENIIDSYDSLGRKSTVILQDSENCTLSYSYNEEEKNIEVSLDGNISVRIDAKHTVVLQSDDKNITLDKQGDLNLTKSGDAIEIVSTPDSEKTSVAVTADTALRNVTITYSEPAKENVEVAVDNDTFAIEINEDKKTKVRSETDSSKSFIAITKEGKGSIGVRNKDEQLSSTILGESDKIMLDSNGGVAAEHLVTSKQGEQISLFITTSIDGTTLVKTTNLETGAVEENTYEAGKSIYAADDEIKEMIKNVSLFKVTLALDAQNETASSTIQDESEQNEVVEKEDGSYEISAVASDTNANIKLALNADATVEHMVSLVSNGIEVVSKAIARVTGVVTRIVSGGKGVETVLEENGTEIAVTTDTHGLSVQRIVSKDVNMSASFGVSGATSEILEDNGSKKVKTALTLLNKFNEIIETVITFDQSGSTTQELTKEDGTTSSVTLFVKESNTTVDEYGSITTVATLNDNVAELKLNSDGTVKSTLTNSDNNLSTEVEAPAGATAAVNEDGSSSITYNTATTQVNENGNEEEIVLEAKVDTQTNGKSATKFTLTNLTTGQTINLNASLSNETPFAPGNTVSIGTYTKNGEEVVSITIKAPLEDVLVIE